MCHLLRDQLVPNGVIPKQKEGVEEVLVDATASWERLEVAGTCFLQGLLEKVDDFHNRLIEADGPAEN